MVGLAVESLQELVVVVEGMVLGLHIAPVTKDKDSICIGCVLSNTMQFIDILPLTSMELCRHTLQSLGPLLLHSQGLDHFLELSIISLSEGLRVWPALEYELDHWFHLFACRQVETEAADEDFPLIRPVAFLDKTKLWRSPHELLLC